MDQVLAKLVRDAEADTQTLALVLHGSRAVGHERPDSDYDVYYVRTVDERPAVAPEVEPAVITIDELRAIEPYWFTDGMVQGRVLVDKTDGELDSILGRLRAVHDVEQPYDAYLNHLVRGKSSVRRGDELGARLHAAESVRWLVATFSALEGTRPPFHDRLSGTLGDWEPRLLAILREPDASAQLELYEDVRDLMESHGIRTHDGWKEEQLR
ncbi:MAG: hypothetical protein QOH95_2307 [Gaiellaceae bacterium]|jgi:hypothetical protein|nr:hypothetical protein [Gaiellaceae bacterium]